MPKRLTPTEKRSLSSTECPNCKNIVTFGSRVCRKCGMRFAQGALEGLRLPKHAKTAMGARGWAKRY